MPENVRTEYTVARFVTGPIQTNTYVLSQGGSALVVDPSSGCSAVVRHCELKKLAVRAIVLTHGHFDHLLGIPDILEAYGAAEVWAHPDERVLVSHAAYNGSDMLGLSYAYTGALSDLREGPMSIGGLALRVIHVPGHSPGGCALLAGEQLIAGDTLFAGSIGRADLPGGDMELLLSSIRDKLLTLPANTVVWPGHGNRTTIGREARLNPFLAS